MEEFKCYQQCWPNHWHIEHLYKSEGVMYKCPGKLPSLLSIKEILAWKLSEVEESE